MRAAKHMKKCASKKSLEKKPKVEEKIEKPDCI